MYTKRSLVAGLGLLALLAAIASVVACEPDYKAAGHKAGEVYGEAATRAALDPTAAAIQRATDIARAGDTAATVAAEAGERAPTVAAEVGERAPTVAAQAAEAAREFTEGVEESGACSGAAITLVAGGFIVALVRRGA